MKAYRIMRTTLGHYIVRPMNVGSKFYNELSVSFERFYNSEKQQHSDYEMFCNEHSVDNLLNYIYNDLGCMVYGNKRYYKTVAGAKKYILTK